MNNIAIMTASISMLKPKGKFALFCLFNSSFPISSVSFGYSLVCMGTKVGVGVGYLITFNVGDGVVGIFVGALDGENVGIIDGGVAVRKHYFFHNQLDRKNVTWCE